MIDRRVLMMAGIAVLTVGIPDQPESLRILFPAPGDWPKPEISAQAWRHIGSSMYQRKSGPNFGSRHGQR